MEDFIAVLNLIVLFCTLLYVKKYTETTKAQTKELIRQRGLSVMPSIFAQVISERNGDKLELTNIGNGIALNLKVCRVYHPEDKNAYYDFQNIPQLKPNDNILLGYIPSDYAQNLPRGLNFLHDESQNPVLLNGEENKEPEVSVLFSFQDIEGTEYNQCNIMGRRGYKQGIVEPHIS